MCFLSGASLHTQINMSTDEFNTGEVEVLASYCREISSSLIFVLINLYCALYRAVYAMLIATRLPKGTDVSFITEMIEVIFFI